MFDKLLIANRGEIACRVIRAAKGLGIETIAVYSEADAGALHVSQADQAIAIGPAPAEQSYLNADKLVAAARQAGADAVHPGYGFLAENADFAQACAAHGIVFVGPPPAAIAAMGSKVEARRIMQKVGVPVTPGYHGTEQDEATLLAEAEKIGFPVMLKAALGGGGRGMREAESAGDFSDALKAARREARAAFGADEMLLEKLVPPTPGMWKSRCSATTTATRPICSSETAPFNAAIRRSWKKPPRLVWRRSNGRPWASLPLPRPGPSTTPALARWNSSWMKRARVISWR